MGKGAVGNRGVWVGVVGVLCLVLVGLLVVVWLRPVGGGGVVSPSVVVSSSVVLEPESSPSSSVSRAEELLADEERWGGFPPPVIVPDVFKGSTFADVYILEILGGFGWSKKFPPRSNPGGAVITFVEEGKPEHEAKGLSLNVTRVVPSYKAFAERILDLRRVGQATCGTYNTTERSRNTCVLVAEDGLFRIDGYAAGKYSDVELEGFLREAVAGYREFYGES